MMGVVHEALMGRYHGGCERMRDREILTAVMVMIMRLGAWELTSDEAGLVVPGDAVADGTQVIVVVRYEVVQSRTCSCCVCDQPP